MKRNIRSIFKLLVIIAIGISFLIGNVFCILLSDSITLSLCGDGTLFEGEEFEYAQKLGDEMCREIAEEGIVLLKNANGALPLGDVQKVNVFGWSSTDAGFILSGSGSGNGYGGGHVNIQDNKRFSFLNALASCGYEYNTKLTEMYESYKDKRDADYTLVEPDISYYTADIMQDAKEFSDTAIIVIGRYGGENIGEIPDRQIKFNGLTDYNRTYLQTSVEEENILNLLSDNFEKVIAVLNTCNNMHLNFLRDDRVDAALFVGATGQSGAKSIAKILKGDITPSGKTTNTYVYDPTTDPTWANRLKNQENIQYSEDIYFGYKWYETAQEEKFFANVDNEYGKGYKGTVQFSFGYGLSYTTFDWEMTDISLPSGGRLQQDSRINMTFSVTNSGDRKGKDVIQIYCTPQYREGGIEKPYVRLVAFAKTALLQPGETQKDITLSFTAYDLSSYDAYDKNDNAAATYEIDKGEYEIKIMTDAHSLADIDNAVIKYYTDEDIIFDCDPKTRKPVENRLTGSSAYAGVPVDGSNVGVRQVYLSRANFEKTFPAEAAPVPEGRELIERANRFINDSFDTYFMPEQGIPGELRLVTKSDGSHATLDALSGNDEELVFNESLMLELGADYDSPLWKKLLDQMTFDDICVLAECSGYRTSAIESIGKPLCRDYDGPSGFNTNIISPGANTNWTVYPNPTLLACSWDVGLAFRWGLSIGVEGSATNVNGWYAPGVNLHRSPYNARNFEYYSEDALLSGKIAAEVVKGAKVNNVYCFVKHLVLSEPGDNPKDLNTWVTESNLRENYLKPFEIAVKEGGANALMTAYNRVGAVWAGANYAVNYQILRQEWGFEGVLLSDYTKGSDNMTPEQGIRAGNDIWLNPDDYNPFPLNRNNPTLMTCARNSAKNLLFTYANTFYYAKTFDWDENDKYKAVIGVKSVRQVFPWWIPALIIIDTIAASVLAYYLIRIIRLKK